MVNSALYLGHQRQAQQLEDMSVTPKLLLHGRENDT